jgi:beta-ribofuranosylaminobenzene 5'-phosphate synthase
LTGKQVRIKTLSQEIKGAGDIAIILGVDKTEEVNFRRVQIIDQKGRVLVNARSWIPLSRLEPAFQEDLLKADVPIGKLLIKHRIEARRELVEAKIVGGRIVRTYDLIRFGKILMRIEESFEDMSGLMKDK